MLRRRCAAAGLVLAACTSAPRPRSLAPLPYTVAGQAEAVYGVAVAGVQASPDGRVAVALAWRGRARALRVAIDRRGVVLYAGGIGYPALRGPTFAAAAEPSVVRYEFELPAAPRDRVVLVLHAVEGRQGALPAVVLPIELSAPEGPRPSAGAGEGRAP